MDFRQLGRGVAVAIAAAGAGLALAQPAFAQQPMPSSSELDPSAPLDPLPDLEVEWPDMEAAEPVPPPPDTPGEIAATPPPSEQIDDSAAAQALCGGARTDWTGSPTRICSKAFREQSALEDGIKKPANAAQIDRRARADAELLTELLHAEGYYDARVEPRIEVAGVDGSDAAGVTVFLDAAPGEQYRFASVELPGLEAAGEDAAKLREAFAVKAGRAGHRGGRHRGRESRSRSRSASRASRRPRSASRTLSSTMKRGPRGWFCRSTPGRSHISAQFA